ncbi:unnamed protein product [Vitrella brassicaformis CCMP3155]|uniref:Uncharacterized protein n=1 Tax=Vitrella brassicaformis (strain CCMP3155) TaxID=1169540 RepID=A0A0G4E9C7_VITBC|nr:unnamed protein product [Vitrella brassicaformis CCMP3155]|eukprot:CEL92196.1 unnamed protein product [Vitrella brassicaformis CCMP3155]
MQHICAAAASQCRLVGSTHRQRISSPPVSPNSPQLDPFAPSAPHRGPAHPSLPISIMPYGIPDGRYQKHAINDHKPAAEGPKSLRGGFPVTMTAANGHKGPAMTTTGRFPPHKATKMSISGTSMPSAAAPAASMSAMIKGKYDGTGAMHGSMSRERGIVNGNVPHIAGPTAVRVSGGIHGRLFVEQQTSPSLHRRTPRPATPMPRDTAMTGSGRLYVRRESEAVHGNRMDVLGGSGGNGSLNGNPPHMRDGGGQQVHSASRVSNLGNVGTDTSGDILRNSNVMSAVKGGHSDAMTVGRVENLVGSSQRPPSLHVRHPPRPATPMGGHVAVNNSGRLCVGRESGATHGSRVDVLGGSRGKGNVSGNPPPSGNSTAVTDGAARPHASRVSSVGAVGVEPSGLHLKNPNGMSAIKGGNTETVTAGRLQERPLPPQNLMGSNQRPPSLHLRHPPRPASAMPGNVLTSNSGRLSVRGDRETMDVGRERGSISSNPSHNSSTAVRSGSARLSSKSMAGGVAMAVGGQRDSKSATGPPRPMISARNGSRTAMRVTQDTRRPHNQHTIARDGTTAASVPPNVSHRNPAINRRVCSLASQRDTNNTKAPTATKVRNAFMSWLRRLQKGLTTLTRRQSLPPTAAPPPSHTHTHAALTQDDAQKVIFFDLDDTLIPSHYLEALGVHLFLAACAKGQEPDGQGLFQGVSTGQRESTAEEVVKAFEETGRAAEEVIQQGAFERLGRALKDAGVPVISARQRALSRLLRPSMDNETMAKQAKEAQYEISKAIAMLEEMQKRPSATHVASVGDQVWDLIPLDEIKRRRPDMSVCKIRVQRPLGVTHFLNQLSRLKEAIPTILRSTTDGPPTDHNYGLRLANNQSGAFEAVREADGRAPGHDEYISQAKESQPDRLDHTVLDDFMDTTAPPDEYTFPLLSQPPARPHITPTARLIMKTLANRDHLRQVERRRGMSHEDTTSWRQREQQINGAIDSILDRLPPEGPHQHGATRVSRRAEGARMVLVRKPGHSERRSRVDNEPTPKVDPLPPQVPSAHPHVRTLLSLPMPHPVHAYPIPHPPHMAMQQQQHPNAMQQQQQQQQQGPATSYHNHHMAALRFEHGAMLRPAVHQKHPYSRLHVYPTRRLPTNLHLMAPRRL